MADIRPFTGWRPADALAGKVIAPPYDVLTEAEAQALAENRRSFVRVTRSEVDLPAGTDAHSQAAYDQARATLDAFLADGILVADERPAYYLYGQKMGEHAQIGVIAACSVAEYDDGRIKKHEFTRPDKEDDRTHHMEVLEAQVGLVFLAYRPTARLSDALARHSAQTPAWRVVTEDGVEHALWVVDSPADVAELQAAYAELPALYIADGHHRSAAASRVNQSMSASSTSHFMAGLFPADHLQVMAYNRVVHDLNGLSDDDFLARVDAVYVRTPTEVPEPAERGALTMYFRGAWWALSPRPGIVDESDPVARLDVAVLQDRVLGPVLGIEDPRRSQRITFVGGIRGAAALSAAVDGGHAVAFHLYPTGLDQLFDVADADQVMPPKSTWFEPKLREGVVVRPLRD